MTPDERASKILVTVLQWVQTHVYPPDEPETFIIFRLPMDAQRMVADEIRTAIAESQESAQ